MQRLLNRHLWISVFVAFWFVAIAIHLFVPPQPRAVLERATGWFIYPTGLWQNFVTFAPDPIMYSLELDAEVIFDDGSTVTWFFPRPESMSGWERIAGDKYRRLLYRSINDNPTPSIYPSIARYIAKQVDSPRRHPDFVQLVMRRRRTPPPSVGIGHKVFVPPTEDVLLHYMVTPSDLQ